MTDSALYGRLVVRGVCYAEGSIYAGSIIWKVRCARDSISPGFLGIRRCCRSRALGSSSADQRSQQHIREDGPNMRYQSLEDSHVVLALARLCSG